MAEPNAGGSPRGHSCASQQTDQFTFSRTFAALDGAAVLDILPAGRTVKAPEVLFRKIEETQVAEWRERFGGPEAA